MHQMVKERIGRHEIICPLGEGGMAQVYLGFSRGPADVNKLVVMKLIRSELARDKRFVTMFLDEARLATRLSHPNVVHTYDVLEEAGQYILTMEYLEGQSLFDVFQRIDLQYFPLDLHLWILTQVLAGLQYAHALPDYNGSPLGVVHRDVSPENTFVTYNGEVKLLDFGIAKAAGAVSVTNRGTFKGKLAYCAPEQLQGDGPPDARADIFAVGVMLWEALAGKRIEVGDSCAQLAQIRLMGKEPRIREVRPEVAPALAEMCDRAMALNPADRYLSAVDLQRDLERYLASSGKRAGRAELGELMRGHFEIERQSIRKQIQEHLLAPRKAPLATRESTSPSTSTSVLEAPFRATRHRVTALSGNAPRMFRNREVKTQEASSPPAMWSHESSVLPETLAAPVRPVTHVEVPVEPRRFLTRRVLILAALLGGGAAAALGAWKRLPRPSVTVSTRTPPSMVSVVKPSEPPPPMPAPVAAPIPAPVAAPAPWVVRLDYQGARPETKPKHASRAPARVARKLTPPRSIERSMERSMERSVERNVETRPSDSTPPPESIPAAPPPSQIVRPGMDLDPPFMVPFIGGPSRPIDESNPYMR